MKLLLDILVHYRIISTTNRAYVGKLIRIFRYVKGFYRINVRDRLGFFAFSGSLI